MEWTWSSLCLSLSFVVVVILLIYKIVICKRAKKFGGERVVLPPGPPGWPVIGNLFDVGLMPHRNFNRLREKYGGVIWLRIGSIDTMLIQSPKAAAELFQKHDLTFSDRKVPGTLSALNYSEIAMATSDYGPYWRVLRRLYANEFFSHKGINDGIEVRQECVAKMIRSIEDNAAVSCARGGSGEVEIIQFLLRMSFKIIGKLLISKDFGLESHSEGSELFSAITMFLESSVKPNIGDLFPSLKWFDPLRIMSHAARNTRIVLSIIEKFVKERIRERESEGYSTLHDFLDVLLDYKGDGKGGPDNIPVSHIAIYVLETFFGGMESSSSSIEWAMTELLRAPSSMIKVKQELDRVIGQKRNIKESDFDRLPYLQAIVKETLRLHPSIPLIVRRNAKSDVEYMGYFVPKGTQVLVNSWAIGRDPEYWDEPHSFKPERFIGSSVDFKGHNFEFVPFGFGRRICVGYPLGQLVVTLGLASLLHSFDWEVLDSLNCADMTERIGVTLRKLRPLKIVPKRRNF